MSAAIITVMQADHSQSQTLIPARIFSTGPQGTWTPFLSFMGVGLREFSSKNDCHLQRINALMIVAHKMTSAILMSITDVVSIMLGIVKGGHA